MTFRTIKLSSYEKWLEEDYHRWSESDGIALTDQILRDIEEAQKQETYERNERLTAFPYSVMLELAFPEYDFANRWCWKNIGPSDGNCEQSYSQYPGCPLVLATESVANDEYTKDRKVYQKVESHSHCGRWCGCWFGKTDYDFGFNEWYFADESDRDRFLSAVSTFNWGENYPRG